ncbi:hypothetical protein C6A86_001485 [Mycobacterium sp. ITM-2016-00316]|uniref:hypothetical protein n=1 Tax=Mycobacterium sp. ITM-2016-00316 TaxID=2099695 RepID=UPI000CF8E360|nr:hypothetical protein [Mycobacterium sp. ITM-2016-00316]WNG82407.1 hypothetical protein C6A86_001485 [Mycobacterium sp. ITM-2016-00316]
MGTGPGRHARSTPHTTVLSLSISFAVAFAAVITALLMHLMDSGVAASRPAPAPVAATTPVTQEGRVVAISPDSLTAQGPDGVARTYRIDDQTHGITAAGSQLGGTAERFTLHDEVSIIGVIRGGDNLATTVVHRDAADLNGPPMDYALP